MERGRQSAPDEASASIGLAAVPSAPFWARRQVKAVMSEWRMDPDAIDTAELLASELVTNAVQFTAEPAASLPPQHPGRVAHVSMTMRHIPGLLIIEVSDQNMNPPALKENDLDSEGGRGLVLVQALSKEWSYYFPRPGWKTVYCVISI